MLVIEGKEQGIFFTLSNQCTDKDCILFNFSTSGAYLSVLVYESIILFCAD